METGLSGLRGRIVVSCVVVVINIVTEHALTHLLNSMENGAKDLPLMKMNATNTHVQLMETGRNGPHGRPVARNVIMAQKHVVEHVQILLLSLEDNPVKVCPLTKKGVSKNHAR